MDMRLVTYTRLNDSGCLEWVRGKFASGYGSLKVGAKYLRAHRYVWETFKGTIPKGLCVCHRCDNPACINLDHLFLATHKENMEDREAKGRGVTPNPRGGKRPW